MPEAAISEEFEQLLKLRMPHGWTVEREVTYRVLGCRGMGKQAADVVLTAPSRHHRHVIELVKFEKGYGPFMHELRRLGRIPVTQEVKTWRWGLLLAQRRIPLKLVNGTTGMARQGGLGNPEWRVRRILRATSGTKITHNSDFACLVESLPSP